MTAFIAQYRRKLTTPHVVAEINARIKRDFKAEKKDIWKLVFSEFKEMRMDEETLRLLAMPEDLVVSMGAVDVSLLKVAASLERGSCAVLSIDGPLIAECMRAHLQAFDMREVIAAELS